MPTLRNIVEFKFCLYEDVEIVALKLPARIMARSETAPGILVYRCVWWAESIRKDEYLFEFELREKKKGAQ